MIKSTTFHVSSEHISTPKRGLARWTYRIIPNPFWQMTRHMTSVMTFIFDITLLSSILITATFSRIGNRKLSFNPSTLDKKWSQISEILVGLPHGLAIVRLCGILLYPDRHKLLINYKSFWWQSFVIQIVIQWSLPRYVRVGEFFCGRSDERIDMLVWAGVRCSFRYLPFLLDPFGSRRRIACPLLSLPLSGSPFSCVPPFGLGYRTRLDKSSGHKQVADSRGT